MVREINNQGQFLDFVLNKWVNCGTITEMEKSGKQLFWEREFKHAT